MRHATALARFLNGRDDVNLSELREALVALDAALRTRQAENRVLEATLDTYRAAVVDLVREDAARCAVRPGQIWSDDDHAAVLDVFLAGHNGVSMSVLREAVSLLKAERDDLSRLLGEPPGEPSDNVFEWRRQLALLQKAFAESKGRL